MSQIWHRLFETVCNTSPASIQSGGLTRYYVLGTRCRVILTRPLPTQRVSTPGNQLCFTNCRNTGIRAIERSRYRNPAITLACSWIGSLGGAECRTAVFGSPTAMIDTSELSKLLHHEVNLYFWLDGTEYRWLFAPNTAHCRCHRLQSDTVPLLQFHMFGHL